MKVLLTELRNAAYSKNVGLWERVADDLERPSRHRRVVNLSRLARNTKANDIVVIPGKLLGSGELNHSLTVAAWKFSDGAKEKVKLAKGTALDLSDFLKNNPDVKKVKIIG